MPEPELGVFLMPIYTVASWYGLYADGGFGNYVLPIALAGWIWAGVNTARTRRLDLGIVTFLLVLIPAMCERAYGPTGRIVLALSVSSIMVAGNYSLVIAFWGPIQKDLSKAKSPLWMSVFWGYCVCMMAFWVCVSVKTWLRGEAIGFAAVEVPPI